MSILVQQTEPYTPKHVTPEQMIRAMAQVRNKFADKMKFELALSDNPLTSYCIECRTAGAHELYDMLLGEISLLINS